MLITPCGNQLCLQSSRLEHKAQMRRVTTGRARTEVKLCMAVRGKGGEHVWSAFTAALNFGICARNSEEGSQARCRPRMCRTCGRSCALCAAVVAAALTLAILSAAPKVRRFAMSTSGDKTILKTLETQPIALWAHRRPQPTISGMQCSVQVAREHP